MVTPALACGASVTNNQLPFSFATARALVPLIARRIYARAFHLGGEATNHGVAACHPEWNEGSCYLELIQCRITRFFTAFRMTSQYDLSLIRTWLSLEASADLSIFPVRSAPRSETESRKKTLRYASCFTTNQVGSTSRWRTSTSSTGFPVSLRATLALAYPPGQVSEAIFQVATTRLLRRKKHSSQ
jgi:hypothetical protein